MAIQRSRSEQVDRSFSILVGSRIDKEGFEFSGSHPPGFLVSVADSQYVGVVCSRSSGHESDRRIVTNIHGLASGKNSPVRVVVVKARVSSEDYRSRMKKSFGVDVIEPLEIGKYLREWQEAFDEDTTLEPKLEPSPKATLSTASVVSDAGAIIAITKSLALQLDA